MRPCLTLVLWLVAEISVLSCASLSSSSIGTTTEIVSSGFIHEWGKQERVWRWKAEEYPSPMTHPRYCRRFAPGYVCDPDDILTVDEADQLDDLIVGVRKKAPCICSSCPSPPYGIAVGVALMKYMFVPSSESKQSVLAAFERKLHQSWNISSCGDHIIIIIVVTNPRGFYTAVGPALTDMVTMDMAERIIVENMAYFNAGNYSEGLNSVVQKYQSLLSRIMLARQDKDKEVSKSFVGMVVGIVVGCIVLAILVIVSVTVYRRRKDRFRLKEEVATSSNSWNRGDKTCVDRPFFMGTPSNGVYQTCCTEDEKAQKDADDQGLSSGVDSDTPLDSYEPVFTDEETEPSTVVFKKVNLPHKDPQPPIHYIDEDTPGADASVAPFGQKDEKSSKGSRHSVADADRDATLQAREATGSKTTEPETPVFPSVDRGIETKL